MLWLLKQTCPKMDGLIVAKSNGSQGVYFFLTSLIESLIGFLDPAVERNKVNWEFPGLVSPCGRGQ